jgi:hypothetical protein
MPFVYEEIPAEDWIKYGIDEVDHQFMHRTTRSKHWTRDHERDMYLRYMRSYAPDDPLHEKFIFYWRGLLMEVDVTLKYFVDENDCHHAEWTLYKKTTSTFIPMPKPLQERDPELLADLKEALTAYKTTRPSLTGKKLTYHLTFKNF